MFHLKIYLQVDGGSENANQYILHHLEHLVSKRVAREIWYTRLPTGHTHDDIDGCFGVIRKYFTATKVYCFFCGALFNALFFIVFVIYFVVVCR
jgi:hypothetical protein